MKRYLWLITVPLALALLLAGCNNIAGVETSPSPAPTPAPTLSTPAPGSLSGSLLAIEERVQSVYTKVNPSVVNIQVLIPAQGTPPSVPQLPGLPPTPRPPQPFGRALGSGFVWDTEGHLVTNNHVVSGADRIRVTFYDGTIVSASLVGTDPDSDLAVIKVDALPKEVQAIKMADSAQLRVGQLAIAIGNPFGLQGTMTVGFVSGLGRLLPSDSNTPGPNYSIPDVIQTDAALNPGNSGGVLLNDAGQVIGVTSAIASSVGTSAGVGFAIPSAIVQKVVPDLIKSGSYEHPWLGVTVATLNPDLADAMSLQSGQRGALVVGVTPNSPADKAGLHPSQQQVTINGDQVRIGGDLITALDRRVVKSSDDIVTYLARYGSVGQVISLTVLREGKETQVQVTLGARPRA